MFFDRRSAEQIRRDNARLKAEREVNEDFRRRDAERRALSKENFNLKHGRKVRVVKKVGSETGKTVGWIGRGLAQGLTAMGNQYAKAEASKRPKKRRVKRVRKKRK